MEKDKHSKVARVYHGICYVCGGYSPPQLGPGGRASQATKGGGGVMNRQIKQTSCPVPWTK